MVAGLLRVHNLAMRQFFNNALDNIVRHGDTDIFPFPFENFLFFDKRLQIIDLLLDIHSHFRERLAEFPPAHEGALAPISYTGFRWATQLDPLWNTYFLGLVLAAASDIEKARIHASERIIFSYRFRWELGFSRLIQPGFSLACFYGILIGNCERIFIRRNGRYLRILRATLASSTGKCTPTGTARSTGHSLENYGILSKFF